MIPVRALFRRLTHGLTLGVRAIVVRPDDHVLLVRHSYTPGWHLPGGGVDVGETAEDAARRELREEANVTATGPLTLLGVFFNPGFGGRDHVACYVAPTFSQGPLPRPNLEIRAVAFFPLQLMPPDTSPATVRRLAELRGDVPVGMHW